MARREPCSCALCTEARRQRTQRMITDPTPADGLLLLAAILFPVLVLIGIVATWQMRK